jgi:hypothetical protein
VVAVPDPTAIERNDERRRLFERLQPRRRGLALLAEHGIAQRSAHAVEHGGTREEAKLRATEPREVLEPKVVSNESIVTGKVGCRPALFTLQEESRQVQAGRPAFRPPHQLQQVRLAEVEMCGA